MVIRKGILQLIRAYQKTFSPDHGVARHLFPHGACRFTPTCSEYAYRAIERFGVGEGLFLAVKRVLRCHPWNPGGFDDIPGTKRD